MCTSPPLGGGDCLTEELLGKGRDKSNAGSRESGAGLGAEDSGSRVWSRGGHGLGGRWREKQRLGSCTPFGLYSKPPGATEGLKQGSDSIGLAFWEARQPGAHLWGAAGVAR